MRGTIARKGLVAGLAAALLLSGLFVGVSYGGASGISEPQVIEIVSRGCFNNDHDPLTECADFKLQDGPRSGNVVRFKVPMFDIDGNPVGKGYVECVFATKTGSICTVVLALTDGPHTDAGTIISTGLGIGPRTSAITGGSGAYSNVRGELVGSEHPSDPDAFLITLYLTP